MRTFGFLEKPFKIVLFILVVTSLSRCSWFRSSGGGSAASQPPGFGITSPTNGSYINDMNKAAFVVSGTCPGVGSENIEISGAVSKTLDCMSGYSWSAPLDFTEVEDGPVSITVTYTDPEGTVHEETLSLTKDTVAPEVDWVFPLSSTCATASTGANFEVSGKCTSGDGDVILSSSVLASSNVVPCDDGEWNTHLKLNLTGLGDLTPFTIQASQTDAAGNSSQSTRSFKKLVNTVPTVVHGGWDDIYAVGPKVYASNPGEPAEPTEPGVVRIKWKEWPSSNTCAPERVKVYRASAAGAAGTLVSDTNHPDGIRADVRSFTDTTLNGATSATADTATDFGKGWYYTLKATIAGTDYDVTQPNEVAEVRVVAPPANMALVHRWIANQEVCGLMDRETDAENHYRCSYSGWGKSSNGDYYDLEHDLLVDRYELACNFTSECGSNGDQPCLASFHNDRTNPNNAPKIDGADGQVYYNNVGSDAKCYVKIAGTWYEANSSNAALTLEYRAAMSTNLAHKPPLVSINQARSYETCQAHTVTLGQVAGFGTKNKRLLRALEWRAAAAWSTEMDASGFDDYDTFIDRLEVGGADYVGMCNSSKAHGGILTDRMHLGTNAFYVGSKTATVQCQSRYGIQDMVGNVWEWVSDQVVNCTAQGLNCIGIASPLDPGNTFMDGFKFDGVNAPEGVLLEWRVESKNYGANYFSVPLGIPMISDDDGNAISIDSWLSPSNKFHRDRIYFNQKHGVAERGLFLGGSWDFGSDNGRWESCWNHNPPHTRSSLSPRCAVPVEY